MTPNTPQQSTETFDVLLQANQEAAVQNAEARINKDINYFQKKGQGDYGTLYDQMLAVYKAKGEELIRDLKSLEAVSEAKYLLQVQKTILASLQKRLDLVLDTFGGGEIAPENFELRAQGVDFFKEASVPSLLYQNLLKHHPDLAERYASTVKDKALLMVPDFTDVLDRIQNSEISKEDWDMILENFRAASSGSDDWVKKAVSDSLCGALSVPHRYTFLEKISDWPDFPQLAEGLLIGNYVTPLQVSGVASEKADALEQQLKTPGLGGKEKAELEEKIISFRALEMRAQSKEVTGAQAEAAEEKKKIVKRMSRGGTMGHFSSARQLLTFKGVAGTLIAANGLATIAANGLMHIKNPSDIFANPAIKLGLGMTLVGLEMNNGFGGQFDTPTENLSQFLTGGSKKDLKEKKQQEDFKEEVGRHPKALELYYQFAKEINIAYNAKRQKQTSTIVELTMEEMGINWDVLPEKFHHADKQETEKTISAWVTRMAGPNQEMSVEEQSKFLNTDVKMATTGTAFEAWTEARKLELMITK